MSAAPASSADAGDLEAKAVAAYEAGNFEEAARLFEAAYAQAGDPNLLYNVGRVYEEAGQLEKAIEYYDRFVHAEGVGLDTRVVASERLSQLKKVVGQDSTAVEPVEPAETTPPAQEPTTTDAAGTADLGEEEPNRAMAISGYVLLGLGVPTLVTGSVFGVLALKRNERLENEQLEDPTGVQEIGRRQALTADILVPVGAALAITGLTLVLVNAGRGRTSTARLSPAIGREQAGLTLSGRF